MPYRSAALSLSLANKLDRLARRTASRYGDFISLFEQISTLEPIWLCDGRVRFVAIGREYALAQAHKRTQGSAWHKCNRYS